MVPCSAVVVADPRLRAAGAARSLLVRPLSAPEGGVRLGRHVVSRVTAGRPSGTGSGIRSVRIHEEVLAGGWAARVGVGHGRLGGLGGGSGRHGRVTLARTPVTAKDKMSVQYLDSVILLWCPTVIHGLPM